MAIDPSIALGYRPPQINVDVPSPIQQYATVMSLRDMMTRQQMGQMQLQQAQLGLQQAQQKQKDDQLLRQAYADAGGDLDKTQNFLIERGGSPDALASLRKHQLDAKKTLAEIADKELATHKYQNDQLRGLTTNALNLPDDQYAAQWPTIKQSALLIRPDLKLPDQPIPKDTLKTLSLGFATQEGLLKEEAERRTAALAVPKLEEAKLDTAAKQIQADANILATAITRGPEAFATALAKVSPQSRGVFEGAATSDEVRRRALTSAQYITAQQAAETAAETKRHQAVVEAETARHNRSVEQYQAQGNTLGNALKLAGGESQLRQDYLNNSKPFQAVTDAYGRIKQAVAGPASGATDIALLYGYMKILDPNSAVREGEFATAQNAGGIPDKIRAQWNSLLSGDRLSTKVRSEMLDQTERLYGQAMQDHRKVAKQYGDVATRQGLNPQNVVLDFESTLTESKKQPATTGVPKVKVWNEKTGRFEER
jgi:hypothetical protein